MPLDPLQKMAYAIARIGKISSAGKAGQTDAHNERKYDVKNADPEKKHLNQEFVKTENRPTWDLANERCKALDITPKKDAVCLVEFMLTASPEFFKKGEDIRNSDYFKANLKFMQDRYGQNLLTFTLHQDETTPHFQALIVPITTTPKTVKLKNGEEHTRTGHRLTAAEMFNKQTLRQLQSDYADAMAPFGLVRGVEKSPAKHEDIKRTYGLNRKVQELDAIVRSGSEIVDTVKTEISDLTDRKGALADENQRLAQQLTLQQQQIQQLQRRNDDLHKAGQIVEKEIKVLREQKTSLEMEVSGMRNTIKTMKSEVVLLQSDVRTLSEDNGRLLKENDMQRQNLKYLQKQANESRQEQGKAIKEVIVPPKPELKIRQTKL